jgi:hypothetical protein
LSFPPRIRWDHNYLGGFNYQPVFTPPDSNSAVHLVGKHSECLGWPGVIYVFVKDTLHLAQHQSIVANCIRHRLTFCWLPPHLFLAQRSFRWVHSRRCTLWPSNYSCCLHLATHWPVSHSSFSLLGPILCPPASFVRRRTSFGHCSGCFLFRPIDYGHLSLGHLVIKP